MPQFWWTQRVGWHHFFCRISYYADREAGVAALGAGGRGSSFEKRFLRFHVLGSNADSDQSSRNATKDRKVPN